MLKSLSCCILSRIYYAKVESRTTGGRHSVEGGNCDGELNCTASDYVVSRRARRGCAIGTQAQSNQSGRTVKSIRASSDWDTHSQTWDLARLLSADCDVATIRESSVRTRKKSPVAT